MRDWLRYICDDCGARWTMGEVTPDYPDTQPCRYCPSCAGTAFNQVDE